MHTHDIATSANSYHKKVVDLVFCVSIRCKPGVFLKIFMGEESAINNQAEGMSHLNWQLSILLCSPRLWLPRISILIANLCIKILRDTQNVMSGYIFKDRFKLIVERLFVVICGFVCWSIACSQGHFRMFPIESSSHNAVAHGFPPNQRFCRRF